MSFRELLKQEFAPYGQLTEDQIAQLERHFGLLQKWNPKLNLTRILRLDDAVRFHYCESLYLAAKLPPGPLRIVDVGSGAGFPGIPVAIYRPECEVTLVESHQRKATFLREASRGLKNLRVESLRAESLKGSFDWMIARAVAPDEILRLGLASMRALLVGGDDARKLGGGERVPWGKERFLVVPRETS